MSPDNFLIPFIDGLGLTDEEASLILSRFEERTIPKKTVVLSAGNIAAEAYFIARGCMRVYYVRQDTEISAYFFTENMFTNACESFIGQKPSRHFMEAAEECRVWAITYAKLEQLYADLPGANTFFRKIIEERFEAIHHSFTSQILDSPEERYQSLMSNNPDLLKRIPQHQIATYLGITPVSLSRIRNRLRK